MPTVAYDDLKTCPDCANLIANGEARDDEHAAMVAKRWPASKGYLVLDCPENCGHDSDFELGPCAICGDRHDGSFHRAAVLAD